MTFALFFTNWLNLIKKEMLGKKENIILIMTERVESIF